MRFLTLIASLAFPLLTLAQEPTPLAQPGAYGGDQTSALTTYTSTRTVERVVQTVTATRNGTEIPVTTTSYGLGTGVPTAGYGGNATWAATGTVGGTGETGRPIMPSNGAGSMAVSGLGMVGAVAIGLLVGL
nr:hypothetical protein B0A51_08186 [Rachicladosporium sp. CCFEE 5018]